MVTLGLQLYTVRDDLAKDFAGTLRAVAKAGYTAIEGGPGKGMTAEDYVKLCKGLGLSTPAGGCGLDGLEKDLEGTLHRVLAFGAKYMMLGWIPPERRKNAADWKALAKSLNVWGKAAHDHGIVFQYHNHDFEFAPVDGTIGLEILLAETDPACVKFQLDVGWVTWAGSAPAALMRKMGKTRIRVIHLKDCVLSPAKAWTEVGTGALDLKGVVAACNELGVEYAMIEQDTCARPPLESIAISYANARKAFAG